MSMTTPGHAVIWGYPRIPWHRHSPLSPRFKWSYVSWDAPGCPGMSQDVLGYPDTVATATAFQVQVVLLYLSWDVLGYPDTVATAPESQIQVVLSVLGCPSMSWDIPTQWLQPLSPRSKWFYPSWDVPGCPGISRHSGRV